MTNLFSIDFHKEYGITKIGSIDTSGDLYTIYGKAELGEGQKDETFLELVNSDERIYDVNFIATFDIKQETEDIEWISAQSLEDLVDIRSWISKGLIETSAGDYLLWESDRILKIQTDNQANQMYVS